MYSLTGVFAYYRRRQKSPMVLFWHDVANNASPTVEGESFPIKLFCKQIVYLKKHYEIISLDEYYRRYTNHSFTNREVVLTFDDGYRNNLLVAAPILKAQNIPFTVFVSSNNVDLQKRFYVLMPRLIIVGAKLTEVDIPMINYHKICKTDEERVRCANEIEYRIKYLRHEAAEKVADYLVSLIGQEKYLELCTVYPNGSLLTWCDVKELHEKYNCTIGSHCMDHCVCHQDQDKDVVNTQIVESRKLIEKRTGIKCDYFAYPNGDFTTFSNSIVEKEYKMGFSTERIPAYSSKSLACIGRIGVPSSYLLFKYAITMGAKQYR